MQPLLPLHLVMAGLVYDMQNFGVNAKQTLVMRVTVPEASTTWALNICPPDHKEFSNVLFHYNPRKSKGHLVQNNRVAGRWVLSGKEEFQCKKCQLTSRCITTTALDM